MTLSHINLLIDNQMGVARGIPKNDPEHKMALDKLGFLISCQLVVLALDDDGQKREFKKVCDRIKKYEQAIKEANNHCHHLKVKEAKEQVNKTFNIDHLRKQYKIMEFVTKQD